MLMTTIDVSLNRLFRVQRARPLLQQVLMYWAVLTLGPVLIGGSLSMTTFAVGVSFGWLQLGQRRRRGARRDALRVHLRSRSRCSTRWCPTAPSRRATR